MAAPLPDEVTWETSDLGTAAYVHMRGLVILGVRRGRGGGGRFIFMFEDPKERGPHFQVEYLNSESRQFDAAVRSLKKLCYDGADNRDQARKTTGSRR